MKMSSLTIHKGYKYKIKRCSTTHYTWFVMNRSDSTVCSLFQYHDLASCLTCNLSITAINAKDRFEESKEVPVSIIKYGRGEIDLA